MRTKKWSEFAKFSVFINFTILTVLWLYANFYNVIQQWMKIINKWYKQRDNCEKW